MSFICAAREILTVHLLSQATFSMNIFSDELKDLFAISDICAFTCRC